MKIHKLAPFFFFSLSSIPAISQNYVLKNEKVILSFETQAGKRVALVKDKNNKYLIYRFGSRNKVELAFPERKNSSWLKFTYSFVYRGGGRENAGLDLNYIAFFKNGFKYVIYQTYFAEGEKLNYGIKVFNTKTQLITDIKGITKTSKGGLIDFRTNGLLKIGGDIYD